MERKDGQGNQMKYKLAGPKQKAFQKFPEGVSHLLELDSETVARATSRLKAAGLSVRSQLSPEPVQESRFQEHVIICLARSSSPRLPTPPLLSQKCRQEERAVWISPPSLHKARFDRFLQGGSRNDWLLHPSCKNTPLNADSRVLLGPPTRSSTERPRPGLQREAGGDE